MNNTSAKFQKDQTKTVGEVNAALTKYPLIVYTDRWTDKPILIVSFNIRGETTNLNSGILSERQTVWIKIGLDFLILICVKIVCKGLSADNKSHH